MKTTWISNLKTTEQKTKFKEDLKNKLLHDPVFARLREILDKEEGALIRELLEDPNESRVLIGELRQIKKLYSLIERPKD